MFEKIKKIFLRVFYIEKLRSSLKSKAVAKDSREHERYTLTSDKAASIIFSDSFKASILNISYGGFAIASLGSKTKKEEK